MNDPLEDVLIHLTVRLNILQLKLSLQILPFIGYLQTDTLLHP